MGNFQKEIIAIDRDIQLDAFGRKRVSSPVIEFDVQQQYDKSPLFYEEDVTGSASSTHLPNQSSVQMDVTGANGDKIIRQTKRYLRYRPGNSKMIMYTGIIGVPGSNVRKRWGYFDADNGIFFEHDGTNLKVVRRTKTSGSVVDNAVNQSSWNLDTLDGGGDSGVTIDIDNDQIYIIDFQWLGAGRIRVGIDINGEIIYCHEFLIANTVNAPSMTTGNLPVRYEIENTAVGDADNMVMTCISVINEDGNNDITGIPFCADNGTTKYSVNGSNLPVLAVRPKTTFNSITNRGQIIPQGFFVFSEDNTILYRIIYGASITGGSWNDVDSTNSMAEYNTTATAISGGFCVDSGYIPVSEGDEDDIAASLGGMLDKLILTNNFAGTTTDTIAIVCSRLGSSSDVLASLKWKELR